MVAQLAAPHAPRTLSWLLPPDPPRGESRAWRYGWELGDDGRWRITPVGESAGPMAQRILLSYALRFGSRAELSRHYRLSERQVQGVISGEAHRLMTAPIRRRLVFWGIGDLHQHKGLERDRAGEIRAAMQRVMQRALLALSKPSSVSANELASVKSDLYLLSGAWLDQERPIRTTEDTHDGN